MQNKKIPEENKWDCPYDIKIGKDFFKALYKKSPHPWNKFDIKTTTLQTSYQKGENTKSAWERYLDIFNVSKD